nr:coiled-coil domain-containing protein 62-like [Lytechinus pictus]
MCESSRASIGQNLSSMSTIRGEPSPYPTKDPKQSERKWTDNFNSEPFHSTPKSLSYPTLLPQHSAEPSPLRPATPNKSSPLASGAGYGSADRNGLALKKSSSPSSLYSPQRMQSSPGAFLQSSLSPKKSYTSDLENTTIQKQRQELQLLIRELQDRDRELNEMVASHQRQLLAWEQDRQKLLGLETKCARYEGELKNRREYIKSLKTRLKVLGSQDQSKACALETMQEQLRQLSDTATAIKQRAKDAEEDNAKLKTAVHVLSEKVNYFEAREQELTAVVRLKNKDLIDASAHIAELSGRLKKLDLVHKETKQEKEKEKMNVVELKTQLDESFSEVEQLKSDLIERANRSTEHKIEITKFQEQLKNMEAELELSGEREKRKDQLLDLQRSKQDRTDAELTSLRQAYERQHRELSLLQLNIESQRDRAEEAISKISLETDTIFDSKKTTPTKNGLSAASISPVNGESPFVSSAGEGGMALNHSSVDTEELLEATHSEQLGMSPTSKLHRLLTESRQMVENLEQSTLPPFIANSSPSRDQVIIWPR